MTSEVVDKIKKLERLEWGPCVETRGFWILYYCYFVHGKDKEIRWTELEKSGLMSGETLVRHISFLIMNKHLKHYKTRSKEFYKLTSKAKLLIEQQLQESEILLQLRKIRSGL